MSNTQHWYFEIVDLDGSRYMKRSNISKEVALAQADLARHIFDRNGKLSIKKHIESDGSSFRQYEYCYVLACPMSRCREYEKLYKQGKDNNVWGDFAKIHETW